MKRKNLVIITFVLLFLMFAVFAFFNRNNKSESSINLNVTEINPVIKNLGSLNILVDPRIELLSAVQIQSDYEILTNLEFSYGNDMKEYFKDYKEHIAVKTFKKLKNSGFSFSYDAPPTAMLYLSNPPALEQRIDYDTYIINRAGTKNNLEGFVQHLREFSSDAKFTDFYEKNLPLYQALVDNVYTNLKEMDITKALDDYYGMQVNSYNIILAPMFLSGGYGPRINAENGLYDVYAILGPANIINGQNGEIIPDFSTDTIRYLTWHEFSHSFVNPTTDKYVDEINKYRNLYTYISQQMESQAYGEWIICVNEHIVRAITTRLTYIYQGQTAGDQAMASEKARGFYYIEELCKSLETYEENRDIYPTFESYYKELINVFKKLSEQDPDNIIKYEGPIYLAFNFKNLDMVFITPTNEENKTTQDEINKDVIMIKNTIFPKAEILLDVDALKKDLGDYVIIAYGTMEGNLWLQNYKDTFPFQVASDKLVVDREYDEKNLVFISALPNPQNNSNPMVLYTAQQTEDILNINSITHGVTDYLIAKNGQEISSGFYNKKSKIWEFTEIK